MISAKSYLANSRGNSSNFLVEDVKLILGEVFSGNMIFPLLCWDRNFISIENL
tara:strand:+ start:1274 stop:1432 length:159 start_codon:yes stop_codon:yes gene_type:complete